MIPYKSSFATVVPKTLEKRLEIMQAIRALAPQNEDEQLRKQRAEIVARRRLIDKLELTVYEMWRECEPQARSYVIKYSPGQPRVPAGNADGGQWTSDDGGATRHSTPRLAARRISPAQEAECEKQYEQDLIECRMVGLSAC
jgi:hypothetical protein